MVLPILLLVAALVISGVAIVASLFGLVAIFPSILIFGVNPVLAIGSVFELGKLVAVSFLYREWNRMAGWLRGWLLVSVIVAMVVTSIGSFGLLSKAHVDQSFSTEAERLQIEQIDNSISRENFKIDLAKSQLAQLDSFLTTYRKNDFATRGLKALEKQAPQREAINGKMDQALVAINKLKQSKQPLLLKLNNLEKDIGPLKFMVGEGQFGTAVKVLIVMLTAILDPFAIALLIGYNHYARKEEVKGEKSNAVVVSRSGWKPAGVEVKEVDMDVE